MYDYSSSGGPGWSGKKSSITSVVIQSGATSIGDNAFNNCPNLQTVTMADTVTSIGEYAFAGCAALKSVVLSKGLLSIGWYAFSECRTLSDINLPSQLQTIGEGAFAYDEALTKLEIPGSVTSIGMSAWYMCSSLKTVQIPGSVRVLGDYAFDYCKALTEVTLDEGVEAIGPYAFWGDTALKTVHIPASLEQVGENTFLKCERLADVYYNGDKSAADKISIGNGNTDFTDANWHFFSTDKIVAYVTRCYEIILGRGADEGGLNTWVNELNSGRKAAAEIIEQFVASAEFQNKNLSNADAVEILYKAMLGRESDPSGKADWLAKLNAGQHITAVINGFCGSAEFKAICDSYGIQPGTVTVKDGTPVTPGADNEKIKAYVERCYQIILGRGADEGGLNTWMDELTSGRKAAAEIIEQFVASAEFQNKKLSNSDSVEILYKAMLGRGSDPAGKASWVEKLDAGQDLTAVINGFCGSAEFKAICDSYGIQPGTVTVKQPTVPAANDEKIQAFVARCYKIILGRDADEGGMNTWFNELKSGRKAAAEIIESFVNSQEFQNKKYSNADAVEILYKAMLGRGSDPAGKADWVEKLNAGQPVEAVINGFCGSAEFKAICDAYGITPGTVNVPQLSKMAVMEEVPAEKPVVKETVNNVTRVEITNVSDTVNENLGTAVQAIYINEEKAKEFIGRCYRVILGREAGAEELNGWIGQMMNGSKTADQIARGFLFSGEFKGRNIGNEELVKILYRVYLNREADTEGLATWTQKLDEGTGLNDLLNVFAKTNEFKAVLKNMAQ